MKKKIFLGGLLEANDSFSLELRFSPEPSSYGFVDTWCLFAPWCFIFKYYFWLYPLKYIK
mgnify:CR=1 FL=1